MYGDLLYSLSVKTFNFKKVPLNDLHKDIFLGIGKSLKEINFIDTALSKLPNASFTVSVL